MNFSRKKTQKCIKLTIFISRGSVEMSELHWLATASSATYRFQSGHTHIQSKTIRTSDLSLTTVIRLHTKPISPPLYSNIVFRRNLQERFWHNAVLPLQLQKSGTVNRKISETVVLWKLSDANLKLTCLTVNFLPRLVSPAPTNRLL